MVCNDEDEEKKYLPTAPLDVGVWLKEPILVRDLCIHMPPGKSEASYNTQTTAYQQEYIPEQTTTYPKEYIPELVANYQQEYIPKQAAT